MTNRDGIRIAIAGLGNCASALIQGIHYYTPQRCEKGVVGLMHREIAGYLPCDIKVVAAFDVDARKVGTDVSRAIFAKPNCTKVFQSEIPDSGVIVTMGQVLDGISEHMAAFADDRTFLRSDATESTQARDRRRTEAKRRGDAAQLRPGRIGAGRPLLRGVRAGSRYRLHQQHADFIASDKEFADRFKARNLPIIGDDVKSQLGATITHRVLTDLFAKRGVKLLRTYQLNTGGNTDFLNMKNPAAAWCRRRLQDRGGAIRRQADASTTTTSMSGPSDYVPWQNDNKICFLRMEGQSVRRHSHGSGIAAVGRGLRRIRPESPST